MIDYLFTNITIVTMNKNREILENCALAVKGERIVDIGITDELIKNHQNVMSTIDGTGKILFPGLINTHCHSFQTLLKGLGADTTLEQWLDRVITPTVTRLREEQMYHGAILSGLDAIRSGTTTILDYQYVQYRKGMNDATIQGYRDLGLRVFLARGYSDTGVQFGAHPNELENLGAIEKDVEDLLSRYHYNDSLVNISLAPSVIWMCSPKCLDWTREFSKANNLIVTAHIAETVFDLDCSKKLHGHGDYQTCENHNLVGNRFLMVHCVNLTHEEIMRASSAGAHLSYNPISNMYLASGSPEIKFFKESGMIGSFGTDGAASNNTNDMLETMKTGVLLAKVSSKDPTSFTALDALAYATCHGAESLGLEDEIGSLEIGKRADLFVFDPYASSKACPVHDPVATLIYSSDPRNIESVLINGQPALWNNQIVYGNEDELLRNAAHSSRTLFT